MGEGVDEINENYGDESLGANLVRKREKSETERT